jgi:organic radical activating enzyme
MTPAPKPCVLKGQDKVFVLHQNLVSSCCRARPEPLDANKNFSDYLTQWRHEQEQLAQGIELASCDVCWQQEQQGLLSHRLQHPDVTKASDSIEIMESILCDHMCSYCSPKYSSTWQDSIKNHGNFKRISLSAQQNLEINPNSDAHQPYWIDQILQYVSTCEDNSVELKLQGGEPLMQFRNLERLLEFNSKKLKLIKLNTNLCPPNNKFLRWLLDTVPAEKLSFDVSMDASPDYNHIPRHGFDKKRFMDNLDLLIQHKVDWQFVTVVSALSVFDLGNFVQWTNQNGFKTTVHKITNPDCLIPELVPSKFKQPIWSTIKDLDVPEVIKEVLTQDNELVDLKLFELYNYLYQYFTRTGIQPMKEKNSGFVEYWSWLESKFNSRFRI